MTVFFDSDVLIDLLLERYPFVDEITELLILLNSQPKLYTSVLVAANIHYIIQRAHDKKYADLQLELLLKKINLLDVTALAFRNAQKSNFKDFEDGIQYQCCLENKIDYIITRNTKDYSTSSIPVFKANEMIVHLLK